MRTWKLRDAHGRVWPELVSSSPLSHLIALMRDTEVEAFDETEAAEKLLAAIGLTPTPCCHLEDEPCARCSEAAYDRAQAAREEGYGPEVRQPTPDEIRASDADRGTLRWEEGVARGLFPPVMPPGEP